MQTDIVVLTNTTMPMPDGWMYACVANGTTEDYYPVRSVLDGASDKSGTFIVQNTTLIIEKANF